MKAKAFFLDRDGTLNIDYDFVHVPEEWDWCEGAIEALKWMKKKGFLIIVVTNQSGIARGHFTLEQVNFLHGWVDKKLEPQGIKIDKWQVCPWHPDFHEGKEKSLLEMRKPATGMFTQAIQQFNIDPNQSFMIGDKISDLQPAIELGITPYYIRSRFHPKQDPDFFNYHGVPQFDSLRALLNHIKE